MTDNTTGEYLEHLRLIIVDPLDRVCEVREFQDEVALTNYYYDLYPFFSDRCLFVFTLIDGFDGSVMTNCVSHGYGRKCLWQDISMNLADGLLLLTT